MNPAVLLQWHYLIFLAPFCLAAMLLLLSSLRLGHHHAAHGSHGHVASPVTASSHTGGGHAVHGAVHAASAHGTTHAAAHGHAHHHGASARHNPSADKAVARNGAEQRGILLALLGTGRAPLPMVVEAFFMVWGLSGCLANQFLLKNAPSPGLLQVLPVMGIAAACGLLGARLAAEMITRLMPEEESSIVSRDGLFGLKGKVAFPVSEAAGRIMVYDDFGSLHDESCRVVPGHPPIERGRKVMVMDRDIQGNLLVEEIPE